MQSYLEMEDKKTMTKAVPHLLKCSASIYVMMDCGPVWLPFENKVIRTSSVLAALKHLQMMRNTKLKQPQPTSHAPLLGEHVYVLGHTGALK